YPTLFRSQAVHDERRGGRQEVGAHHVVQGEQFAQAGAGHAVVPVGGGGAAGAVVGVRLLARHGGLALRRHRREVRDGPALVLPFHRLGEGGEGGLVVRAGDRKSVV